MKSIRPLQAIGRGLRKRCPRCGEGRLFRGWNRLYERCPVCGLAYERHTGDTWFVTYITTAGLSGALVVGMFLLHPRIVWLGQALVVLAAIVVIGFSLPYRKGLAVALDFLVERHSGEG
ncbi:MAG TPA: DUF983 domain-containing protein [Thermoanaerobaculia bacterium]|nr:DUF983 domain-containing protein [Thermoanaerobaculia bacterium]